jgi:hypothetical protein
MVGASQMVVLGQALPFQGIPLVVEAGTELSLLGTWSRSTQSPRPHSNAKLGNSMGARAGAPNTNLSNVSGASSDNQTAVSASSSTERDALERQDLPVSS